MNSKMIVALIAVLAIFVLTLDFMNMPTKVTTPPTTTTLPTATTVPVVTGGEESILSDQINSLTEEELAAISTDLTDFSTTSQDSMAGDSSLFMYQ